jgi:hypothetical protein
MSKITVTNLKTIELTDPNYPIICYTCGKTIPCVKSTCLYPNDSEEGHWVCSNELCITMGMLKLL